MEIPDFVQEEFEEIKKEYNQPISDIRRQYKDIYNTDWIQEDDQFDSDKDRHSYCIRRLWIDISAKGEEVISVIPFGYEEARTTQKGTWQSKIFTYAKLEGGWEKKTLVCQGDLSALYESVDLFCGYKVKCNNAGAILMATDNTEFEGSKPIPKEPKEFLIGKVGINKVTIADAINDRSRTDDNGYTDELDMRYLEGIILQKNNGERDDGSEWAYYRISDDSTVRQRTTKDGKVIPKNMMIWVPKTQQIFDEDSEVGLIGTITGDKEPVMNAYAVIPIHAREV